MTKSLDIDEVAKRVSSDLQEAIFHFEFCWYPNVEIDRRGLVEHPNDLVAWSTIFNSTMASACMALLRASEKKAGAANVDELVRLLRDADIEKQVENRILQWPSMRGTSIEAAKSVLDGEVEKIELHLAAINELRDKLSVLRNRHLAHGFIARKGKAANFGEIKHCLKYGEDILKSIHLLIFGATFATHTIRNAARTQAMNLWYAVWLGRQQESFKAGPPIEWTRRYNNDPEADE